MILKGAKENLHAQRRSYDKHVLSLESATDNPFSQFDLWYKEAAALESFEANAMVISSVKDNIPQSRVVLLKEYSENGFVFFTNYESNKGRELASNPNVSVLFFYEEMQRQIRIIGKAQKISEADSDAYFYSRPLASQYGAMISAQSQEIVSKDDLEAKLESYIASNKKPQRPKHWGGYLIVASYFEFWQGRPSRMHDRICYDKINDAWRKFQVAP